MGNEGKRGMKNNKIALICSSGGHFLQLYSLKDFWSKYDHFWVTFDAVDTSVLLADEKKVFAYHPTNRNLPNLIKNLFLAIRILRKEKPSLVISTGAGVAVPFMYVSKFLGIRTAYIESITRVADISMSGKFVYFIVDDFLVQWPELATKYRKAKYLGQVI